VQGDVVERVELSPKEVVQDDCGRVVRRVECKEAIVSGMYIMRYRSK
jgi:hypothetical protein